MKVINENTVRLSVRQLVEFVLRDGDLDNRRGVPSAETMVLGTQAHKKLQESMGENYEAEVPFSCVRSFDEVELAIDGRADGVITGYNGEEEYTPGAYTIDEIKGIFRDVESLEEAIPVHLAQAEMYAYMLATDRSLPTVHVQITYVQLEFDERTQQRIARTDEIRRFAYHYSYAEIEDRFLYYTGLYEKWARFVVSHREDRRLSADGFSFPYDFRPGQKKIVSQVYKTVEKSGKLFVQAPTGIGKTLAMLYPSVRAVGNGLSDKIFYLTAKTVTSNVAEEGMMLMEDRGLKMSYVKITAKEKMCPLEKMQCDPVHCERAKGYFSRVNDAVWDLITHETTVSSEKVAYYAEKHQVCPYEMSLDVSYYTDVVIADYNYAFSPHVMLQRYFASGDKKDYIFLLDEAHNLPERARDMYSAELIKEDVLAAKKLFPGQKKILKFLEKVNKGMLALKRECQDPTVFTDEDFPNSLIFDLMSLKEAIARFLDRTPNPPNSDEILTFFFEASDFLETYDHLYEGGYVSYAGFKEDGSFFIRLFCIDPSGRLKEHLDNIRSAVFFSATFLPVNYYKELLSGSREEDAMYVDSPFDESKRRIFLARDVSTKYTRRSAVEYRKIADYLLKMINGAPGNYLAFFPSHKFLEEVKAILENEEIFQDDFDLISQKRVMSEEDRNAFLNEFDEERKKPLLGLSVMGGLFSEGIDLKHDKLIGVAVVGTGLPQVCTERELIREFYEKKGENGFDFAYRFPGFNKVMQAAGRLIRTYEDVGVILLLDERFLYRESLRLFPREWADHRIITLENAEEEISRFWKYV